MATVAEHQEVMPGVKRQRNGAEKEKISTTSPFMPMFEAFRDELDEHHDRRERIIKASRDITATSKKIVRTLKSSIPEKIALETEERAAGIQKLFAEIVPDLAGINSWRYQRQISGGIQEYMEAISFQHYLRYQKLITVQEAARSLPDGTGLTQDDYVLGIFDLVGELMRFAITTMATTGSLPGAKNDAESVGDRTILVDLRQLRRNFEGMDTTSCSGSGLGKDLEKKMEVMKTCVEKVETAVYGMIVRGRERPKGWVPDLADDRALLASRPLLTQSITSAVLFATGDVMAQQLVEKKGLKNHEYARSGRMALYGGAVFGPAATTWFRFLQNKIVLKNKNLEIAARVVCDQTIFTTLNLGAFLSSMAIMEGTSPKEKLDKTYVTALQKNWLVWPAVQAVNFKFVPLDHRVLLVNVVALGWNCYLSYLNSH
ncbi:hypothetical protein B7494_g505 [Chlorociboria aeruginascens]|nr:hypothetical protein B7494_g505 [Chlorociboria aeruginascens]